MTPGRSPRACGRGTRRSLPYHGGVRRLIPLAVLTAALVLSACGGSNQPTTPPIGHTVSPTSTPTPTPGPDTEKVEILRYGYGRYMLQAQAVAVVRNDATHHVATGVVVHFVIHAPGHDQAQDSPAMDVAPGETLGIAPEVCTDVCTNASGVDVSVSVGGWVEGTREVVKGTAQNFSCGGGCGGSGYGEVTGTLSGKVFGGAQMRVVADCLDGAGNVVGGGVITTLWPSGSPPTAPTNVSVLFFKPPTHCELWASTLS